MMNYSKIYDSKAMNYNSYRLLVSSLLDEGKTTGGSTEKDMLQYTKMNVQRMNRVDKTITLQASVLDVLAQLKQSYKFLVITEGWCGDAAQIVPVINAIAKASAGKIDLKLALRDENLPLIDAHLTNGGRAIPVLLVLNEAGGLVGEKWGPRPNLLQELMAQWKNEGLQMPEISEKLHAWYAKDKTITTQNELSTFIAGLNA